MAKITMLPCGTALLGEVYTYDNGQSRITFERGGARDWYVWSVKRQQRLATYQTRRELAAVLAASTNSAGPYGCAELRLHPAEED